MFQVANFIIKNSTSAPVVNTTSSQFYDPFTGGNRYIPGSTDSPQVLQNSVQNKPAEVSTSKNPVTCSYIPLTNYLKIEQGNLDLIRGNCLDTYIIKFETILSLRLLN